MLNKIFFWLLLIGVIYGFCKSAYQSVQIARGNEIAAPAQSPADTRAKSGTESATAKALEPGLSAMGKRLNNALLQAAKMTVVDICIPLIGTMALWLGLMNVAKDAGLLDAFARAMRPLMRWLFPEVPDGHPAQGAMLMNFAANMLGLDNAATPLGLKAMEELQSLNSEKDTATNAMAQFLAINCGSITLIPFTIISFRFVSGSKDPSGIILGTLVASSASVIAAIVAARWFARSSAAQLSVEEPASEGELDR
ncbi:MAG TPA: nucleoside recognition domain-containing protein [Lacipirellulaceae bacterium]|nr:nucleoside recognition domain-containing protein [Lacipirellulaceae bacterium]